MPPMYDVPRLGEPFALRGQREVALVLDEFMPTHLDAWLGRALVAPSALPGPSGDSDLPARVLVVRHAGDVVGKAPVVGRRRARLRAVAGVRPPEVPLLGVVVEKDGATLLWLAERDPAILARNLSRVNWRLFH